MTKREYERWISKLAASEDFDTADIGKLAKESTWHLSCYLPDTPANREMIITEFYGGESEFDQLVKDHWITLHGSLFAVWEDGVFG